ncbi:MAG: site-2 protease family protein [Chryseolinea sp.]
MKPDQRRVLLQILLFLTTLVTTTIAGAEWSYGKSIYMPGYSWADFASGFNFSVPFLLILTVHEFGHYFTARYYKIDVTLPYYIPLPPLPLWIGTMGAVIRLKSRVHSKKQNFDIGIAGPLAGFVMTLIVLFYGFKTLPEPEYIYTIHPEYKAYGLNYAEKVYTNQSDSVMDIAIGKNLLFHFFESYVAEPGRVPNVHEVMHYPTLLAGFLSLIFTCMNLFPIGQLDGGHVSYGLLGFKLYKLVGTVCFLGLLLYSGLGFIDIYPPPTDTTGALSLTYLILGSLFFLYLVLQCLRLSKRDTLMYALIFLAFFIVMGRLFPDVKGYSGWLLFVFVIGKFIGIEHPPAEIEEPLDTTRIILGWIAIFILIISFSPAPIS